MMGDQPGGFWEWLFVQPSERERRRQARERQRTTYGFFPTDTAESASARKESVLSPTDTRFGSHRIHPAFILIGILVVALCCIPSVFLHQSGDSSVSTVAAVNAPTDTPIPAGPPPLQGATLGGTWSSFEDKYGPQVDQNEWNTTIAGQYLSVMIDSTSSQETHDGQGHVYTVTIEALPQSPAEGKWDETTAKRIVQSFFPPDAQQVEDVKTSTGTDHVYRSARLATTFVAIFFTHESSDVQVTPGSFHWQCRPLGNGSPGYGFCVMDIGTL